MASNSFGNIFKITTWGESHGKAIGVVIDGCPAGLEIDENEINLALSARAPGSNPYISARKESDKAEILSGVYEGKTTGAPISIIIANHDADSSKYEPIKHLLRPGHANYTYLEKYGIFDHRGGGRASGRETACRVAAGSIAKKLLKQSKVDLIAYIRQIGPIATIIDHEIDNLENLRALTKDSPVFCPDAKATSQILELIEKTKAEGDSLGGIIEFMALSAPIGLGDPVYEKLEANLGFAMMGLPASKGFELGSGFQSVMMSGSSHNDSFTYESGSVRTKTNHAGGTLGGITTGMPIVGRVAFKPTSSVRKTQNTLTFSKEAATFELPEGSRHDPCLSIRAVPVVEAMLALVLADAFLLNKCAKL